MFQTEAALAINCSASSRDMASPPQRILRFPFPIQPDSSSSFQVEGVACMTVAPERRSEDDPALPILLDLAAGALRKRRTTAEQDQVRALRALHEVAVAASGVLDPAALA